MKVARKKHVFLFCMLLLFVLTTSAQSFRNDNSISLGPTMPLQFVYNSADELLQEKLIHNAIGLQVSTSHSIGSVYANILFTNVLAGGQYAQSFFLRSAGMNNEINLSSSPVLLFSQPISSGAPRSYTYDIGLHPFVNFVTPGLCAFSILFTYTQP